MELIEAIKTRRSIRKFKPERLSRNEISMLLDLAGWSPSAHNTQPWRVVIVDDTETKARLAKEMGEVWVSDLIKDGVEKNEAEKRVKTKNWNRITNSPAVLIVCLDRKAMHKYADSKRQKVEYLIAVQSVAAYVQTLLLVAHNRGFGACWECTPLFSQDRVRRVLELPEDLEPQAMIIMGLPDEKPSTSSRKPLNEICAFNSWQKR